MPWVSHGHDRELEVDQYCQAMSLNPCSFSARVWNRRGSERILVPSLHGVSESGKGAVGGRIAFSLASASRRPGLSLARTIQSCQAPVSWKGLSMRRCGIGLVFLVSCHFWTALAQNLPPTGHTLHADTSRSTAGAVSSPIGFAPGSRATTRSRGQSPDGADARECPQVAQDHDRGASRCRYAGRLQDGRFCPRSPSGVGMEGRPGHV